MTEVEKVSKKISLNFLISAILVVLIAYIATANVEDTSEKHLIWGNLPFMYLTDFVIIASAIFAIYIGQHMLSGELKSVFKYVFIGIGLMALSYVLDVYAMVTNNMALMETIHLDLFWVIGAIGFISIVIGFYKMDKLFRRIQRQKKQS